MCVYNDKIYTAGDVYRLTGIRNWDGSSISFGALTVSNRLYYLYPIDGVGLLAQTYETTTITAHLEFTPDPDTTNFVDVTPTGFNNPSTEALHRSFVDCATVSIPMDGTVAVWTMNDSAGQTTVVDDMGNLNGTAFRNITSTTGKLNTAITFDAAAPDYIITGDTDLTGDFTICAWVNFDNFDTYNGCIMGKYGSAIASKEWVFRVEASDRKMQLITHDGSAQTIASTIDAQFPDIDLDEWHFVAVVFDRNENGDANGCVFYKDGSTVADGDATLSLPQDTTTAIQLGAWASGVSDPLSGHLDSVMLFNRALTSVEITTLYNSGNGRESPSENNRILMWWEYGANGESNAYYSTDNCSTWTRLFDNDAVGIKHFHGAVFVAEIERLYIFTGDDGVDASILICDDVGDLISNHETWYGPSRWGLGLTDRDNWTPNSEYVLGYDSQKFRTVDMVCDGSYGYWMPDADSSVDVAAYRVDHQTKAVSTLAEYPSVIGTGWIGTRTSDEQILFTTISDSDGGEGGTPFSSGTDEYVRLYSFTNGYVQELYKWHNPFYVNGVTPSIRDDSLFKWLFEYDGFIYADGRAVGSVSEDFLGTDVHINLAKVGQVQQTPLTFWLPDNPSPIIFNILLNGDFSIMEGPGDFQDWVEDGDATFSQEGNDYAKIVVNSGAPALRQYYNDAFFINAIKNGYANLSVDVKIDAGCDEGYEPMLLVQVYSSAGTKNYLLRIPLGQYRWY